MLVEGTVFEPDETEKTVYVPVETVRYVIIDSNNSNRSQNDNATDIPKDAATSGDYLNSSVDSNTVSVGSETDFTNAIVEYNFLDGKIYEIFTSPNKVTDIRLAPGETISGEAAIGDSESWQMVTASSSEKGRAVTHIYVRPVTGSLQKSVGFVPVGSSQRSEFDLKEEVFSIPEAIGFPPDGLNQVIHAFHLPR